ncbi:MAG TPA: pyroglutamyl-peptidase I [Spirochaetales bacterium]|nr:pyroglutamyl-peptidase I [Spirochaetales bacterium]HRZ65815.1 pyroglutamyl-peptidase I [Spirochaetia bacterium]
MRILLTGFDPFGGEKVNPAFEAVKLVPSSVAGAEIVKLEIPTVFGKCDKVVAAAVREKRPDVVLSIGQAGGRFDMTVERVAVNIADGRIADNEGNQPIDQTIREDGENAYFATLPVKAMVERIRSKGIPASVSYTAGSYVCNYIMYCELYMAAKEFPGLRCGFMHVPFLPAQAIGKPSPVPTMSVENIALAIEAALEAIVDSPADLRRSEGTIA